MGWIWRVNYNIIDQKALLLWSFYCVALLYVGNSIQHCAAVFINFESLEFEGL